MYVHTVVEARSLKSRRMKQSRVPSEGSRGESSLPLPALGGCNHSMACGLSFQSLSS